MVESQSPGLLYSATLGRAVMILATPTGLQQSSMLKAMRSICDSARPDATPLGLRNSPPVIPRVAQYCNPGLED